MKPVIKNLLVAAIISGAILTALVLFPISRESAPDIAFTDIDKQTHQLSSYQGSPTLVIFWATDCPGCIQELPELISLHERYTEQGLKMVAVAMPHDKLEHITSMRDNRGLPYTITWDQSGEIARAFGNVRVTPTHFLISPEGEIVMRKIGVLSPTLISQALAEMGLKVEQS
jgi:peroxiredoxin